MASRPQPERPPRGAEHARLEGAPTLFRYRGARLPASRIHGALICEFRVGARRYQGVQLHDLSATGISLGIDDELMPGTRLERVCITLDGSPVFEGAAEVVHSGQNGARGLGCRLVGGTVDMDVLEFRSDAVNGFVVPDIEQLRLTDELDSEWMAGVGQYVRLFAIARHGLEAAQARTPGWEDQRVSAALCASIYDAVVPEIEEVVRRLAARSKRFDRNTHDIALSYSAAVAQDEFGCGEFLHRAYTKPLGYAGDFWMMELLQMEELRGATLYERFLHMYVKESAMGQSVRRRGAVAKNRMMELIDTGRPLRIVSLACGPAIEIRRLLREQEKFHAKVEFILIDQDERALRAAYEELSRVLGERGDDPMVELHALHFSLRQIIAPKRGAEKELLKNVLSGVDLVYSMGMFDYLGQPLARRTIGALYKMLGRGGSLFIGNLMNVPESSWVMEYCTAWDLVYRDTHSMLGLVSGVDPVPEHVDVVQGAGDCLFLDIARD